jgi:uncharacterized protein (DUF433 family)
MATMLLERQIYGMAQVDGLLGLAAGTARRWIDGYERNGRQYQPVVRSESTGAEAVTWGEFVETRLLAAYRHMGVPMVHMRPVVERLRDELQVPYPLAVARPFAEGRELVARVQHDIQLDERLMLVEVLRTGQIELAYETRTFWEAIDWEPGEGQEIASRLHVNGRASRVVLDPLLAFGAPVVGSVRTDVIAEEARAGASLRAVARGFGVSIEDVGAAILYEGAERAA